MNVLFGFTFLSIHFRTHNRFLNTKKIFKKIKIRARERETRIRDRSLSEIYKLNGFFIMYLFISDYILAHIILISLKTLFTVFTYFSRFIYYYYFYRISICIMMYEYSSSLPSNLISTISCSYCCPSHTLLWAYDVLKIFIKPVHGSSRYCIICLSPDVQKKKKNVFITTYIGYIISIDERSIPRSSLCVFDINSPYSE